MSLPEFVPELRFHTSRRGIRGAVPAKPSLTPAKSAACNALEGPPGERSAESHTSFPPGLVAGRQAKHRILGKHVADQLIRKHPRPAARKVRCIEDLPEVAIAPHYHGLTSLE